MMRRIPLLVILAAAAAAASEQASLALITRAPLPEVKGRIDHFAVDTQRRRLFVAALGNDSVEVVDFEKNTAFKSLGKLDEPQGVAFVDDPSRLFVSCGEGKRIEVFAGEDFTDLGKIETRDDPDNLRYDPDAKLLYVGHGSGSEGAIGVIDPVSLGRIADVDVGGHPEAFALEAKGGRIFVNVPDLRSVVVVDRADRKIIATWPLSAAANFPIAIDSKRQQLLVGCRKPASIIALSMKDGTIVQRVEGPADADDVWYDADRDLVYATGGDGSIVVLRYGSDGQLVVSEKIATASGARTSFFDSSSRRLFVAAPRHKDDSATILVYEVRP